MKNKLIYELNNKMNMKQKTNLMVHLAWVAACCLLTCCTPETETVTGKPDTTVPGNPQADDPTRRSVLIALQNKLTVAEGGTETRADVIAETDENRVADFDVYTFGCDTEEGTYTFQEHFAYRADGTQPAGTTRLDINVDEATGKMTALFYPKKGLYTKFYCVANGTKLFDEARQEYIDYTPLTQASPTTDASEMGTKVTQAGTPTETVFRTLTTPLLTAGNAADVLRTPLPMSGANMQPVDLRSFIMGTFIRLNVRLERAVARFDIENDAKQSHFTITQISLGKGRRGVALFPIKSVANDPFDPATDLITYPERAFNATGANEGITRKAFYCYPGPKEDAGYLILKGRYAMNQTDAPKEVSYTIPFEQVVDGSGMRIEISHNHRYTVQITKADPFEAVANITVADWDEGGDVDYEPENGLDEVVVSDLLPAGKTTYDPDISTVGMSLDNGSFIVTTGSNAGVDPILEYADGSAVADNWLKVEELPATRAKIPAKFKVSYNTSFIGDCPTALLRLTDKASGKESVIIVRPVTKPIFYVAENTGDYAGKGLNSLDAAANTLHLYRVTGSELEFTVFCPDRVNVPTITSADYTLERVANKSTNTLVRYKLRLVNRDATITDDSFTLEFKNSIDNSLTETLTVKLHDAAFTNFSVTPSSASSSYDSANKTVTLDISENSSFTISATTYNGMTVENLPEWLMVKTTNTPTRAGKPRAETGVTPPTYSNSLTIALNAAKVKGISSEWVEFTIKNTCGGEDLTLKVKPKYNAPTFVTGTMKPTINSYASNTLNLYQLASGNTSTAQLRVTSWGGSRLEFSNIAITADLLESDNNEQVYTIKYKTPDTSYYTSDQSMGTLTIMNASDNSLTKQVNIKIKSSLPTFSDNNGYGISFVKKSTIVEMRLSNSNVNLMGISNFSVRVSSPIEYRSETISNSSGTSAQTAAIGTKSGSQGNYIFTITFTFKNVTLDANHNIYNFNLIPTDTSFPTYSINEWIGTPVVYGQTTYNMTNYWAYSPHREVSGDAFSKLVPPSGWSLPSMSVYKTISGRTDSSDWNYTNQVPITLDAIRRKCFIYASSNGSMCRFRSTEYTNINNTYRTLDFSENGAKVGYGYPNYGETHPYVFVKPK